jgi:hypothetical protein
MRHSFWWKNALALAGVSGLAAGTANADITYTLTNQTFTGGQFLNLQAFLGQEVTGTLTAVSVDATLNASTNYTYADDLCVYVDPLPLGTGGLLQVGGFSNLGAAQRAYWANGGSSLPGTTVIDTRSAGNPGIGPPPTNLPGTWTTPLTFAGTVADARIWIGNGYAIGASTSGTWTGTITLVGVNAVPEPTSAGLLLAGSALAAAGIRRRRV